MSKHPMDRIDNIVVPTDFSPLSGAAVARAAALAQLDGAAVHLVHAISFPMVVTPYEVSIPAAIVEGARQAAKEKLEAQSENAQEAGAQKVTTDITDSISAVSAIAQAVEAHDADLVVMGTHGHEGLKHAFLGSVAERTLRTLDVPVLSVKEDAETAAAPISRIVLAVDFSTHSDLATEVTIRLAGRLGAMVDVVHAIDLPRYYTPYASPFGVELEERIHASATERLDSIGLRLEKEQIPASLHFQRGQPSVVIAETAERVGCQLIVMGTRGNSGLSHALLGSVAERTLRAAHCSVLTVKAGDE